MKMGETNTLKIIASTIAQRLTSEIASTSNGDNSPLEKIIALCERGDVTEAVLKEIGDKESVVTYLTKVLKDIIEKKDEDTLKGSYGWINLYTLLEINGDNCIIEKGAAGNYVPDCFLCLIKNPQICATKVLGEGDANFTTILKQELDKWKCRYMDQKQLFETEFGQCLLMHILASVGKFYHENTAGKKMKERALAAPILTNTIRNIIVQPTMALKVYKEFWGTLSHPDIPEILKIVYGHLENIQQFEALFKKEGYKVQEWLAEKGGANIEDVGEKIIDILGLQKDKVNDRPSKLSQLTFLLRDISPDHNDPSLRRLTERLQLLNLPFYVYNESKWNKGEELVYDTFGKLVVAAYGGGWKTAYLERLFRHRTEGLFNSPMYGRTWITDGEVTFFYLLAAKIKGDGTIAPVDLLPPGCSCEASIALKSTVEDAINYCALFTNDQKPTARFWSFYNYLERVVLQRENVDHSGEVNHSENKLKSIALQIYEALLKNDNGISATLIDSIKAINLNGISLDDLKTQYMRVPSLLLDMVLRNDSKEAWTLFFYPIIWESSESEDQAKTVSAHSLPMGFLAGTMMDLENEYWPCIRAAYDPLLYIIVEIMRPLLNHFIGEQVRKDEKKMIDDARNQEQLEGVRHWVGIKEDVTRLLDDITTMRSTAVKIQNTIMPHRSGLLALYDDFIWLFKSDGKFYLRITQSILDEIYKKKTLEEYEQCSGVNIREWTLTPEKPVLTINKTFENVCYVNINENAEDSVVDNEKQKLIDSNCQLHDAYHTNMRVFEQLCREDEEVPYTEIKTFHNLDESKIESWKAILKIIKAYACFIGNKYLFMLSSIEKSEPNSNKNLFNLLKYSIHRPYHPKKSKDNRTIIHVEQLLSLAFEVKEIHPEAGLSVIYHNKKRIETGCLLTNKYFANIDKPENTPANIAYLREGVSPFNLLNPLYRLLAIELAPEAKDDGERCVAKYFHLLREHSTMWIIIICENTLRVDQIRSRLDGQHSGLSSCMNELAQVVNQVEPSGYSWGVESVETMLIRLQGLSEFMAIVNYDVSEPIVTLPTINSSEVTEKNTTSPMTAIMIKFTAPQV